MERLPKITAKRIVITFHSLGDVDAAGAAIALSRALGKKAIIAPPDRLAAAARKLLDFTGTQTTLFSEIKREKGDYIIVLDSSSPAMLPHLAGIQPDLMIDHHARHGGEITAKKTINDSTASSTCEMLCFLIKPKDKISAIALLLGIISDSANFRNAQSRTFEAVAHLLPLSGISYSQLLSLSQSPESLSERIEALRSCESVSADRVGEHIIALAMAKSHEAHFADMLIHMGADIAFVGCQAEEGRISARMRETLRGKLQLGKIMHEIGKIMGGSGAGHECAAGATGARESVREALSVCKKMAEQELLLLEGGKIKKISW